MKMKTLNLMTINNINTKVYIPKLQLYTTVQA